ncbi:hypothetical protein [Paenibacillus radicis (ex Xue et al. 2023)]|uniref:Uncharacterized protein n=1 Tax=Paenibacillus radicis (ex Xue et al. 2023) TaxID=2972489 RepID=A0ABT1YTY9_9BACL|nr:hypothetical protein [Paenibacillus radicis (ex Xue et al. 2023)]MCR8636661.1 hypothetical protein [Paenibacillus radicis (ex Xue et al. 2023)]
MDNIDHLIKKVSKYISFGQPVSSGSVYSQRISDPRIPMSAYYMSMKLRNEEEQYYHEIWLKKEGHFAITEAWYKDSNVSRKIFQDNVSYDDIKSTFSEEDAHGLAIRMTEIIKKSEKEDWSSTRKRA